MRHIDHQPVDKSWVGWSDIAELFCWPGIRAGTVLSRSCQVQWLPTTVLGSGMKWEAAPNPGFSSTSSATSSSPCSVTKLPYLLSNDNNWRALSHFIWLRGFHKQVMAIKNVGTLKTNLRMTVIDSFLFYLFLVAGWEFYWAEQQGKDLCRGESHTPSRRLLLVPSLHLQLYILTARLAGAGINSTTNKLHNECYIHMYDKICMIRYNR